jgi:CheY-like chemotaxis protein
MISSRLLIIEDDTFKLNRIVACLDKRTSSHSVTIVRSVQAAVAEVNTHEFDMILLDMALPSHDLKPGGGPGMSLLSGGVEVVMELAYLGRQDPVIIITQYPEIEIEGELVPVASVRSVLSRLFNIRVGGVIHYRHLADEWETALLKAIG